MDLAATVLLLGSHHQDEPPLETQDSYRGIRKRSRRRYSCRDPSWLVVCTAMTAIAMIAQRSRPTSAAFSVSLQRAAPAPSHVAPFRGGRQRRLFGWNLSRQLIGGRSSTPDNVKDRERWQSTVALDAVNKNQGRVIRSLDEAFGGRRPPPTLDFYEDANEIGSYEDYDEMPSFDGASMPQASSVNQSPPAPSPSSTRTRSPPIPDFSAVPDFREGAKTLFTEDDEDDDDIDTYPAAPQRHGSGGVEDDDNEDPFVEEERVSDLLQYRPPPSDSSFKRTQPSPTARLYSNFARPNSYATEKDDVKAPRPTNVSAFPAYVPPTAEELGASIETLLVQITAENNGKAFNINSPSQVANVLFGSGGGSTRKDVLDGMAGAGNRMADLILKYREAKYKLAKLQRYNDSVAKGTSVTNAVTVKLVYNETASEDDDERDPLILVDVSAYIFRAYYSMPAIHRSDGMPTGAVMGFCKMLNAMVLDSMIAGLQPRVVLCFDAKGRTFRHDMYAEYKGNRPSAPVDLVPQFDFVRQAAKAYGVAQIEAHWYEADDVIATLATRAIKEGVDVNILSGDKDLMQLVTDFGVSPSIQMIDPMKKDRTTHAEVVEKWDVGPRQLGDVLALAGDTADNVPGVKGVGPKTAAKLINEYGSLENLLNNIDNIKQKGLREKLTAGQSDAKLSRELVRLRRDVSLEELAGFPAVAKQRVSELRMEPLDADRILAFYVSMGFRELQSTFKAKLTGKKFQRKPVNRRPKAVVPRPEDYVDVPF